MLGCVAPGTPSVRLLFPLMVKAPYVPGGTARFPAAPFTVRLRMVLKLPALSVADDNVTSRVPVGNGGAGTAGSATGFVRVITCRKEKLPLPLIVLLVG